MHRDACTTEHASESPFPAQASRGEFDRAACFPNAGLVCNDAIAPPDVESLPRGTAVEYPGPARREASTPAIVLTGPVPISTNPVSLSAWGLVRGGSGSDRCGSGRRFV